MNVRLKRVPPLRGNPFNAWMGLEILKLDEESIEIRMKDGGFCFHPARSSRRFER
jgi:hypothetical protein